VPDITLHTKLLFIIISIPSRFIPGVNDDPLYFVCPDLLRAVGEASYGIRMGFIGSDEVNTDYLFIINLFNIYLFIYLFTY